jgi:hypothetical protein
VAHDRYRKLGPALRAAACFAATPDVSAALGPEGVQTLLLLAGMADEHGRVTVTHTELASLLRINRNTAAARLRHLLDISWDGRPIIVAESRGRFQACSLKITLPPCHVDVAPVDVAPVDVAPVDVAPVDVACGTADRPEAASGAAPVVPRQRGTSERGTCRVPPVSSPHTPLFPPLPGFEAALLPSSEDPNKDGWSSPLPQGKYTEPDDGRDSYREKTVRRGTSHISQDPPLQAKEETVRLPDKAKARTRARARGRPDPEVRRLLLRHGEMYRERVGAPYPFSWGKDGACMKRLLATYEPSDVEAIQDAYFAQALDSFAGKSGYTVAEMAREAPGLMALVAAERSLDDERRELLGMLLSEGVPRDTAIALVKEHEPDKVRRQVEAHEERRHRLRDPARALVRAIREGWDEPEEAFGELKPLPEDDGPPLCPDGMLIGDLLKIVFPHFFQESAANQH